MTVFLKDFFTGDFTAAWEDVKAAFDKLPQPVKDFIAKLESDEGKLLETLAGVAVQDVVTNGFTTASFVAAGKDVVTKAADQGKAIAMSDAMAQLNILASSLRPAVAAPVAVEAPPAVNPPGTPDGTFTAS